MYPQNDKDRDTESPDLVSNRDGLFVNKRKFITGMGENTEGRGGFRDKEEVGSPGTEKILRGFQSPPVDRIDMDMVVGDWKLMALHGTRRSP